MYVVIGLGKDFEQAMDTAVQKMRVKSGLPEWMVREYLDAADIQEPLG
jgi:hypothetical protein